MNAIPCLTWVPRGIAGRHPGRVVSTTASAQHQVMIFVNKAGGVSQTDPSNEEFENTGSSTTPKGGRLSHKKKTGSTDVTIPSRNKMDEQSDEDDISKKYGLSDYDDDKDEDEDNVLRVAGMFQYSDAEDDPYLDKSEDAEKEEQEELEIQKDDLLIAMGKVDENFFSLEVYVYSEQHKSLYCHHDTPLASFPLAVEWVGYNQEDSMGRNLCAVGTTEPDIQIWDLDVIDTLEPAFLLTGRKNKSHKKKRKVSGHQDAVLDLAWNALLQNILASASADFTVGLWDLEATKMVSSVKYHAEKVQTVAWHPTQPQFLLSGSFDKTVRLFDCQNRDDSKMWDLGGEVERVLWDKHNPFGFLASCDTGQVYYMDIRSQAQVFAFQAHAEAVTGISLSSEIPGCLLTSSTDKAIKIWDIKNQTPTLVHEKHPGVGQIHCISGCPDMGMLFAVGGERELKIINPAKSHLVSEHFSVGSSGDAEETASENVDTFFSIENQRKSVTKKEPAVAKKHHKQKKRDKKKQVNGPEIRKNGDQDEYVE